MYLLLVWVLIPCLGQAGPDGKPRLHAHRASLEQEGEEMMISAGGQVMRREAKQDSDRQEEQVHLDAHRRQQGEGSQAVATTGETLPVKVEGCQDAATAHVIEGYYMPSGTTGDKPSYKKNAGAGDDEVWLYHYSDVDAGAEGWWIGSNPSGRVHIYAFNPSQAEVPPSSGWKAPWWGQVDNQLQIQTLEKDEVPASVGSSDPTELPEAATEATEAPEEAMATEAPAEAPEEAVMATEAPEAQNEDSAVMTSEAPAQEEESSEAPAVKEAPPELQHLLKEEGEMITAAVSKLSSGKKLADMVFGTDTATIPEKPPSDEMLNQLVKDPALAKKALNKTVSILQGAVHRLESGQVFANELLGTNTSKWLETTEELVKSGKGNKSWGRASTAVPEQPPIEGSAAAPLLKSVDEVASAASDAAEKARRWKDAEIAELHAKQAAEEAKKKVETLTVQAAKEEAEKAIEDAAGGETEAAKEEASKLAARADAEVADKETEVAKAKKKLAEAKDATEEEKDTAQKELEAAETEVKKAEAKAEVLDKQAGKIKLATHKDSDDNALYSPGESPEPAADAAQGPIILGSEPRTDGQKLLEDKLDILQSKLQGLQRVQMKNQLEDRLSASFTENGEAQGSEIRLLHSAPKDSEGKGKAGEANEGAEGAEAKEEKEEPKPKKKKVKGSWNRITVFVMVALGVCLLLGGAFYQLVTMRQMKQSKKADEKTPLKEETTAAQGKPTGEEAQEDPVPAGS